MLELQVKHLCESNPVEKSKQMQCTTLEELQDVERTDFRCFPV